MFWSRYRGDGRSRLGRADPPSEEPTEGTGHPLGSAALIRRAGSRVVVTARSGPSQHVRETPVNPAFPFRDEPVHDGPCRGVRSHCRLQFYESGELKPQTNLCREGATANRLRSQSQVPDKGRPRSGVALEAGPRNGAPDLTLRLAIYLPPELSSDASS